MNDEYFDACNDCGWFTSDPNEFHACQGGIYNIEEECNEGTEFVDTTSET